MTEQWNEARRAQAKKASSYPTDPPRTKWLIALLAEALGEIERLEKENEDMKDEIFYLVKKR